MSVDDFRINASIRRILTRSWVDTEMLRFGAAGRTVYFHGRFEKLRPSRPKDADVWELSRPEDISENLVLLETVEKEIRREPLVVDVVFKLDNFRKIRGKWEAAGA